MKTIQLTKGFVALIDDADYGAVSQHKWYAQVVRRKDGSIKVVYAIRGIHKAGGTITTMTLHRFLLGVTDPRAQVDHKDGNGLHCCAREPEESHPHAAQ